VGSQYYCSTISSFIFKLKHIHFALFARHWQKNIL
jgi:hypothetical protein